MAQSAHSDGVLVERIRAGNADAWGELIARFEGRLLAYVEARVRCRSSAEDVVQETLVGFLTSLPNYDPSRSLESYLFSIAAHKLTDLLRRSGRRPATRLPVTAEGADGWDVPGPARPPSSMLRSRERQSLERQALLDALQHQIEQWRAHDEWEKVQCMELLFVRGWQNKQVAGVLALSEQQVANWKFDFLARLRSAVRKQDLPKDVFPELYEDV
jgi:RNA polymerase sigma-70 factor (ECF subfamily)